MRFRGGNGFAAAPSAFWKPTERFAIESARRSGDVAAPAARSGACIRSRSVNLECRELARRNREGLFEFATPPFSFSSPLFVASSRRWGGARGAEPGRTRVPLRPREDVRAHVGEFLPATKMHARTRARPTMDLGRARLRRFRSNVKMTSRGNARRGSRTRRWRCRSRRSPTSTRARLVRPDEVRGDAGTCHYAPVAPDAWTPRTRASEARREVPRRRGAEHKKVSLLVPPEKKRRENERDATKL